jgi:hypothetical protein
LYDFLVDFLVRNSESFYQFLEFPERWIFPRGPEVICPKVSTRGQRVEERGEGRGYERGEGGGWSVGGEGGVEDFIFTRVEFFNDH